MRRRRAKETSPPPWALLSFLLRYPDATVIATRGERREGQHHRQVVGQLGRFHRQSGGAVELLQAQQRHAALARVAVGVVGQVQAGPRRAARGGGRPGALRAARGHADRSTVMSAGEILLWIIFPYVAIATFLVGHWSTR